MATRVDCQLEDEDFLKDVVELGFIEPSENWALASCHFPSKVGGKPAWLDLKTLPPPASLLCKQCQEPTIFLLQIYAPIDEVESCFHRTLFVFVCKNPGCCIANSADNFVVFSCQLPRKNEYYSYDPPKQDKEYIGKTAADYCKLCSVCGCLAPKRCSRCCTSYCSAKHQTIDWKNGHKEICKGNDQSLNKVSSKPSSSYLLPEYEIITEPEECDFERVKDSNGKSDEERMKDYEEYVKKIETDGELSSKNMSLNDMHDLEEMASNKIDRQFNKFRQRVQHNPDQILRYKRGGSPLWISGKAIPPPESIPRCSCGAPRQFEFQILPQLLNYLDLDATEKSIDWGTVLIYTCSSNSCERSPGYHPEFILKQDL